MVSSIARVKFYFDLSCPNTWASLKIIQRNFNRINIGYEPICDFKLDLKRNKDLFRQQKEAGEIPWKERPIGLIRHNLKDVSEKLQPELKGNWQKMYASTLEEGFILPMLFLTSIKEHFPEYYLPAIYKVGSRFWEDGKPVQKGCYLSTCAREIGLQLRDSEFVISRLSHRMYRQKLTNVSNEAVLLGAQQSPFLVTNSSPPVTFEDVFRLSEYVEPSCSASQRSHSH